VKTVIVRGKQWKADALFLLRLGPSVQQFLGLFLVHLKLGTNRFRVASVKTVLGKLLLFGQANIAVGFIIRPAQIVDAVYSLQERADTLEAIGQFDGNRIKVYAATLLEISELCDLQTIEQPLPANSPRSERRRLPVVLFKANVVLFQIQSDRRETL